MNTRELIKRVREGLLEFGQTPFSDELIINTLNTYGELAYNYMCSSVEDYLEEITVNVPAVSTTQAEPQQIRLPIRVHNYRIDKVYVLVDNTWEELPKTNLANFYDTPVYSAQALPVFWSQRRGILLLTPTSSPYQIKVLYTPKYMPMGLLTGAIVNLISNRLVLDEVPGKLVENSASHWNILSISSPQGDLKGSWQYTADGSSTVWLTSSTLTEYEGLPIVPFVQLEPVRELPPTNPDDNHDWTVRTFKLTNVPSHWEAGMYLETDELPSGTYISTYQYTEFITLLDDALDGTYPFITPDIGTIPNTAPVTYRIEEIDTTINSVTLKPVSGEGLPLPFKSGYLNSYPRQLTPRRFIIEGSSTVTIPGTESLPLGLHTIELSATGFTTQRYQITHYSGDLWITNAILPAGFSDMDVYGNNYFAVDYEQPKYTDCVIYNTGGTEVHTGSLTYTSTGYGTTLLAVDSNGVTEPHLFTSEADEPLTGLSLRITLQDTHSNTERDLLYTEVTLVDNSRLQLRFRIGSYYGSAKPQSVLEGGILETGVLDRRRWAPEFPEVLPLNFYSGTPATRYLKAQEDGDYLTENVAIGDLVSYGATVASDSMLGDVTTFLTEATILGLKNSLQEGNELLYESLRAHWTAVRAHGSMGKRTDTKLVRSRPRITGGSRCSR